ncbi:MAG: 2-succinyl-5-enolpyruvyl-6-hydroxy-3-cyclohexene-1-carboxylic-acid synthase [Bdellovibrionota bacterium]
MNSRLAAQVIDLVVNAGVSEFCICPGARNSPLIVHLIERLGSSRLYYFFEERSATFFAVGRSKACNKPVAVVTTSGTAAAELLPAVIEAHYSEAPIILITADRPKRFRGTGAPQSIEQVGLFGCYAEMSLDLEADEPCSLSGWSGKRPVHLNICFDEPLLGGDHHSIRPREVVQKIAASQASATVVRDFLTSATSPLIIVGSIEAKDTKAVSDFLLGVGAPVYLESTSQLRESAALEQIKLYFCDDFLQKSSGGYHVDSVIRIGGVPTHRVWRDIELHEIPVLSISDKPFSGASFGKLVVTDISEFLGKTATTRMIRPEHIGNLIRADRLRLQKVLDLLSSEPRSEPALVHQLSDRISRGSLVYLGNSMPVREWDMFAARDCRQYEIRASRGANGIDGQVSAFLGMCSGKGGMCGKNDDNWAIIGDLTALYDLSGLWALRQLSDIRVQIVVINNRGAGIFRRMFSFHEFQNNHELDFSCWAGMWGLKYEKWFQIPENVNSSDSRIIEIIPDREATSRFWKEYEGLCKNTL